MTNKRFAIIAGGGKWGGGWPFSAQRGSDFILTDTDEENLGRPGGASAPFCPVH
jgi:hypothetical protein